MNQNRRKKKTFFWIIAACTLCVGIYYFVKPLIVSTSFPDFSSYYYGSLAASAGENPYAGGKLFFTPFVYPPSLLLYMYPLTILPFQCAERVFTLCSMLAYVASLIILDRLFTRRHPLVLRIIGFGFLLATFFPAKFTFGMGQINSIVLLCMSLFLYFSNKRNELAAAIMLAVSLSLKLFPGILILFLVSQKKWKMLFLIACSLLCIGTITIFTTGPSVVWIFITSTLPHLLLSAKTDYYNQSIPGMIARLIVDPGISQTITWAYSLILLMPVLIFSDLDEEHYNLGIILSVISSLLTNTFAWQHHFIQTLPAFFILLSPKYLSKKGLYRSLLLVSYCLIAANTSHPQTVWKPLWSHQTFGTMIVWGLLLYKILAPNPVQKQKEASI